MKPEYQSATFSYSISMLITPHNGQSYAKGNKSNKLLQFYMVSMINCLVIFLSLICSYYLCILMNTKLDTIIYVTSFFAPGLQVTFVKCAGIFRFMSFQVLRVKIYNGMIFLGVIYIYFL